jgi:hypothetical protein
MESWDPNSFAQQFHAGEFKGRLTEELEKLSEEQLNELLQELSGLNQSNKQGD